MSTAAPKIYCKPQWSNSEIRASLHGAVHTLGRVRPGFWGDMIMRLSSGIVASSAVAILSTTLLCALGGTAVSQTAGSSTSLPSVTVVAPQQTARPPQAYRPERAANTGPVRRTARSTWMPARTATGTPAQTATRTAPPAPGSVMGRLAALERISSNCNGGCATSFKRGNAPWVGCSESAGYTSVFSATCTDTLTYRNFQDCGETKMFVGWDRNRAWWYCNSLQVGGKFRDAEAKRRS
jgi:hypothetical protein